MIGFHRQLLSSAYLFGGDAEHLNRIWEEEVKELEHWVDSPGEISRDDWREFLGKKQLVFSYSSPCPSSVQTFGSIFLLMVKDRYQRAFVDFFEDEFVHHGYDWKAVVEKYLYSGKRPLVNCLVSGRRWMQNNNCK